MGLQKLLNLPVEYLLPELYLNEFKFWVDVRELLFMGQYALQPQDLFPEDIAFNVD